jgi:hypothetical protein
MSEDTPKRKRSKFRLKRKTDTVEYKVKYWTKTILVIFACIAGIWSAAVGVGVQGQAGWQELVKAYSQPIGKVK